MDDLRDLCEAVEDELSRAVRKTNGKISPSDVEYLDKLTHMLKSIKTTMAMESGYSSRRDYSYAVDKLISNTRRIMADLPEDKRREAERFVDSMERTR